MHKVSGVHVLEALEDSRLEPMLLVEHVFFMNVLEDLGSDDGMKIGLHEIEDQVEVFVVLGADQVLQRNDVGVPAELPEKNDLAEGALGIGGILECIKDLLDGDGTLSLLVDCLPNDSVGSLAKLLHDFEFAQDMGLYFFCHRVR